MTTVYYMVQKFILKYIYMYIIYMHDVGAFCE